MRTGMLLLLKYDSDDGNNYRKLQGKQSVLMCAGVRSLMKYGDNDRNISFTLADGRQ